MPFLSCYRIRGYIVFEQKALDRNHLHKATLDVSKPGTIVETAKDQSSYPCRRCLKDSSPGGEIYLVSYNPFLGESPYTGPGPIFVHQRDCMFKLEDEKDVVPDQQRRRKLSVRAYNAEHMMINNGVVDGVDLEAKAGEMFADLDVKYIHVHYAGAGGFAVKIERK
ncbi:conserved hypothetical protein [Coccidioides posadasii str. Silveira]|uniref:DUF1203 domain-containing protein n=1 Tax=Coccidioides posadasii (strain RMSCC 757 / Silveira) TaxID=443226 RepID=E9D4X8_COCPS|nr:conserved hypothetical protein [Coccidioides posadasii str. Silveira]